MQAVFCPFELKCLHPVLIINAFPGQPLVKDMDEEEEIERMREFGGAYVVRVRMFQCACHASPQLQSVL